MKYVECNDGNKTPPPLSEIPAETCRTAKTMLKIYFEKKLCHGRLPFLPHPDKYYVSKYTTFIAIG